MVQNRSIKYTFLIPVVLFLFMLSDGFLSGILAEHFIQNDFILVPRLVVLGFVFFSFFFPKQPMQLYAILIGLFFDSYYLGILGVYTISFSAIVYLIKISQKHLDGNVFVLGLLLILAVVFVEVSVYTIYLILGVTAMDFSQFLSLRLASTIILNIVLYILLYYPLYKLAARMND